ncbi:hypothetical protein HOT31_gp032 [Microbacterium phage Hendrix]|uniref:Uncharacterized protein n=1 Tax=Microbacterium phage Hendrix TaxID=2182341 RepID=A0A2U8UUF3_9CAUD|nr:hypothetical protein HOT31_gp032 [Microbacterium phage Hendrix]AWN07703.1 hypothetical protein PBI_HENDRIX_32 [Microbacterium phage Hendrix]
MVRMGRTDNDRVVFDETRHTWLCARPVDRHWPCAGSCVCHCHRPAPAEPDYMNGWILESEM